MANILIVDDDMNIRYLFRCLLERKGHVIMEADDGEIALKLFEHQPPDLMITDVLMPNKEGLELIQDVKQLCPTLKVIALSGGGVVDINDCLTFADAFGADCVFAKPIKAKELVMCVERLLNTACDKTAATQHAQHIV